MNVGLRIPRKIDTVSTDHTLDLRECINFVWRNWILIVSVAAFVFLFGVIYLVHATPLYTASTQVLLEQAEKAPVQEADSGRSVGNYYDICRIRLPS